ncbi:hypothetical protein F7725_008276 [Dissostichus mawsoni]|uniref:Phospholipase B1, membrane-associated n=1 Tax=Dissostichus mawsoni TaxID=36200 RepID=A0A7J5Y7K6_DISMA|nr:hypothetical protein F7725_008276 [Dissostichus mawsoni]
MTPSPSVPTSDIFKLFSPELLGPSPVRTFHGQPATVNETGNVSDQIRHMIDTFKSYPGLNFEEDWKVVTMMIGVNDICDYCKDKIPRTIVNVVQIFPMKPLRDVQRPTLGCQLQKRLEKLLHSERFFKKDFAVVLQPYLEKAVAPTLPDRTIDLSFFTADCFHFTVKGHEELAKGLWKNMEHPYVYTRPRVVSSAPKHSSVALTMFLISGFHYL